MIPEFYHTASIDSLLRESIFYAIEFTPPHHLKPLLNNVISPLLHGCPAHLQNTFLNTIIDPCLKVINEKVNQFASVIIKSTLERFNSFILAKK